MKKAINHGEKDIVDQIDGTNDLQTKYETLQREHKAVMDAINMANIVSEANPRGVVIAVNDKLCEVSQYSREECIGRPHNMFRHPDMPKSVFKELWNTIGSGKIFNGKIKNKRKDGTPYYVDALITPVFDENGKIAKYIGIRTDTTDIQMDLARYKAIYDAVNYASALIEFDLQGHILDANQNFLDVMGYSLSEIKGKHHSMFIDPDEAKSEKYRQFWEDLRAGVTVRDVFKRIGKGGKTVWIRASYGPQKDDSGHVIGVIKLATDVTEEKNRELDLMRKVNMILEVMSAAEKGDLRKEIEVSGNEPVDLVCASIKQFLATLRENIAHITKSTQALMSSSEELTAIGQQMAGTAEETSAQSNIVSSSAEQVSRNIQTVASSAEELNASIREIAKNTSDAANVATQAVSLTDEATLTMSKLGESSAQIGNVVKVITSIAQQTNLLALNATIEAARAGEAGKGFAVVANEVKELAKETAKATEDISHRIEAIQSDTVASVEVITKVNNIIREINETQNTIASAVEEQSATTSEIGRSVSEAAVGGAEISENILGVAQAAKDTAQGASSNQIAAEELARMASELQRIVSQFIYE
ncbi:methyl-accepting chemotaxis protein [Legionella dresdenensis]|uniref:Methyl-accepting chemotaxis protein n=1 Tax=Legionella dresdenensis TaxID=450200 RepID=A0ABV8CH58_9GAMM